MLATYYKLTESEIDDRATLLNSIQEVDKKLERQKTGLKDEEITYALYLEFRSDFEKEREELKKELTKCGQGV